MTNKAIFLKERRTRVFEQMKEGVLILFSAPIFQRNNDVEHAYRQDSDFYYLTGFDEPESVLLLSKKKDQCETILFLRPRNLEREIWDGPRLGVEGAIEILGMDQAYEIDELEERLPANIENTERLYFQWGHHRQHDELIVSAMNKVRHRVRLGVHAPSELIDPTLIIHEMRLKKDVNEISLMKQAADIAREAHVAAMRIARPGLFEYEVEAEILKIFRRFGSERVAYESIVGSGHNATILHYRKNNRRIEEGDLVLIDAGCEYGYYASDVTRTFPSNGQFSEPQKKLYEIVLTAQLAAIEAVKPGVTLEDIHQVAVQKLVEGMCHVGLLQGSPMDRIEDLSYRQFYMHKTSHFLGMDVHDVGRYFIDGERRKLEPGFVITVEPGIYVSTNADVEPSFRGIGIRIEDDILVTSEGYENLTHHIPKTVNEIESIIKNQ